MPQKSKTDETHPVSRWRKFHFSGKVIICSVLFGLGFILIGGLVFAININDAEDEKLEEKANEIPTKAPSSIVGPVIMGIGGFIVTVGIIMCLFETQVCRKRKGDGSPLINERRCSDIKITDPTAIASTSRNHENHRSKKSLSPRKSKGTKKSHSNKNRVVEKFPSSKSPPVAIGSSRNLLSSSESNFHTPPSSFAKDSVVLNSNSRDAENQTGTSLMKSFTSSDPSWNTSTEFRTPEASFKEISSLETSVQTEDLESSSSTLKNPLVDNLQKINIGFLTPVIPSEEITENFKRGFAEQKLENNLLVENSDQSMSFLSHEEQAKTSSNVPSIDRVKATDTMSESDIGDANTLRNSSANSKTELLKEVLTDSTTYVVLQKEETGHTVSGEKNVRDILSNFEIESKNSNTVSMISLTKQDKLIESDEKKAKSENESDTPISANFINTFENLEYHREEASEKETHVNKLTSSEGMETKQENTISLFNHEGKTNNFGTNDMITERTLCQDKEVEVHNTHSSENAHSAIVNPIPEALSSQEQNDGIRPTTNNKVNLHEDSSNSELNSS